MLDSGLIAAHRGKHISQTPYLYVADFGIAGLAKLGISANTEARANELGGECIWEAFAGSAAFDLECMLHRKLTRALLRTTYCSETYSVNPTALARFCNQALAGLPLIPQMDYMDWWRLSVPEKLLHARPIFAGLGILKQVMPSWAA